jgi:DNA invertase Pin-like site-specific DNA recombinase
MQLLAEKQKEFILRKSRPAITLGYIRVGQQSPEAGESTSDLIKEIINKQYTPYCTITETISSMTGWKNREGLRWIVDGIKKNDTLIVYGFSQLGRSIHDVIEILYHLYHRGIKILDIKHNWEIDDQVPDETMFMLLKMSEQIDHEVISARVSEGLAVRKAKGKPLGRKKGAIVKSKLDKHKNEIITLLKTGSTKAYIIRRFKTSKTNLYHWLRQNKLDELKPDFPMPSD